MGTFDTRGGSALNSDMNTVVYFDTRTWNIVSPAGDAIGFIKRERHCNKTLLRINGEFFDFKSVQAAKKFAIQHTARSN